MSRIGRSPVTIPGNVKLDVKSGLVKVEGPKGKLEVVVSERMEIKVEDGTLTVSRPSDHRDDRAQHGLARTLINNAILGVTEGFTRNLEIHGVGFRAAMKGKNLELQLGFSHPVVVEETADVQLEAPAANKIIVSGIDNQKVGQMAAEIRGKRPPEPYKGKCIKYSTEVIRRKEGKTGGKK